VPASCGTSETSNLGTPRAEGAQVARALQAQKICEAEHGLAHQAFDRR
jgi:hypothetical protein